MMIANAEGGQAQTVKVRPMIETDHVDADRIFRMAFGTFLGLPDPMAFAGTTISTAKISKALLAARDDLATCASMLAILARKSGPGSLTSSDLRVGMIPTCRCGCCI